MHKNAIKCEISKLSSVVPSKLLNAKVGHFGENTCLLNPQRKRNQALKLVSNTTHTSP